MTDTTISLPMPKGWKVVLPKKPEPLKDES